jgi:hypothetical protein
LKEERDMIARPFRVTAVKAAGPTAAAIPRRCDASSALTALLTAIGAARIVVGIVAWSKVRSQLEAEKIVIPGSARRFAGRNVRGPLTAYAQADTISAIALQATGGRTYAEIDEGDPAAEIAKDGALLRSSLLTSVLAFGVAAGEVAAGVLMVVLGTTLSKIVRHGGPSDT